MENFHPYDLNEVAKMWEKLKHRRREVFFDLNDERPFNPYDLNAIGELTNPDIVVRLQSTTEKGSDQESGGIEKKGIFKMIV